MSEPVLQQPKIKSRAMKELSAVVTITARDITLFFKLSGMTIMSLTIPILMMGVLGGSLAQNVVAGLGFNYGKFMLVGMLVNMLFISATSDISSLVEDHFIDFIQEMMISPVSRYSIVIGKITGSSFGVIASLIGTLVVGLVMDITLPVSQILAVLALSPFMRLSAGALAMIVIGLIKSNKMANLAVMLITMPQMFLFGAIIPISNSSGVLFVISRLIPMTYCLDLVCAVAYVGTSEYDSVVPFNPAITLVVIIAITVVCLMIGALFFARSEKDK